MTTTSETQPSLYEQLRNSPYGWRKKIAVKLGVHYNTIYNTLVLGMKGENAPAIIAEAEAIVKEWEMKMADTKAKRLDKLQADFEAAQAALHAELAASSNA